MIWFPDRALDPARALTSDSVDTYESLVHSITQISRPAPSETSAPLRSLLDARADAIRDLTAIQLSTLRWILEL